MLPDRAISEVIEKKKEKKKKKKKTFLIRL